MNLLEGARIALASLRTNKLRTFLTLLGNIVGTMSVIAVVSLINGIDTYARQKVLDEGTDVFTITRVSGLQFLTDFDAFLRSLNNPDLTVADRDWLAEKMTNARAVGAALATRADLRAGSRSFRNTAVRGKTEDYPLLEDIPLALGRHLTRQDVAASRPVAIIGWDVARDLYPGIADPTGRTLKIGRRHFEVVGVAEDRGTVLGNNRNQFAVIPITTYEKVFGAHESVDIKVAAGDVRAIEDVRDEARFLMRVRHRLRPLEEDNFSLETPDQLLNLWAGISKAIYGALTPLVGISLVIGGIVLMNIMLIAVTERTREIGVRKALGATRGAVLWQFLVEAMTLSAVGGVLGISCGFGLAGLVALLSPLPFAFAPWAIGLGLGVTLVIGLFFGTFPAWKAASLDPVEALRYEWLGERATLHLRESLGQASDTMRGHKMRSGLLILGVAIGVATLLAIVTIVGGLSNKIRNDIVSASRPYLYVARFTGMGGEDIEKLLRRPQIKPECLDAVARVEGVDKVDYFISNNDGTVLHYEKERTNFVQVFGTSETFPYLFSFTLEDGRYFTQSEVTARSRVCVLGNGPRADLFPRQDPIGKTLNLYGRPYLIVGAMEARKQLMGQFGDNFVAVPWTAFEKDFANKYQEDRNVAATVAEGHDSDEVMTDLIGALRQARRLAPGEPNDFEVVASETYGELVDKITQGVALVLVVLSSIGLMVGGIGVMNIMLISVTERTREIGIRMAIGARRQDLLTQVLIEAGTLTGIGGVIGIALGYLLSWGTTKFLHFPFAISPFVTLGAVLFSVAIGVVFGVYPANRAARMDPVEALRYE